MQALQNNMEVKRQLSKEWRLEPSRLAHKDTSPFIFSQKVPNTGKKYKCDFLLDVSSSMFWGIENATIIVAVKALKELIAVFSWVVDFRVIAYGSWFKSFSPNQILSAKCTNDDLRRLFNVPMEQIDIGGLHTVIPWEGGSIGLCGWTEWTAALKSSIDELKAESWDKFIITLTDWDWSYWGQSYWGVSPLTLDDMPSIITDWESEWIRMMPIEIGSGSLWNYFSDVLRLRSDGGTDGLYDGVINFINTNFNK